MSRRVLIGVALLGALAGAAPRAPAPDKVDFQVYKSYFESNKSGLAGDASYLAFTDQGGFDRVLRPVPPLMGRKPDYMPRNVFESKLVAVVIKRGNQPYEYKVEKVTGTGDTLTVQYKANGKGAGGGTARFASPLVLAVDKGKYTSVVFIENGEKAGTAKVGK
jgi:hypothetical protein